MSSMYAYVFAALCTFIAVLAASQEERFLTGLFAILATLALYYGGAI